MWVINYDDDDEHTEMENNIICDITGDHLMMKKNNLPYFHYLGH